MKETETNGRSGSKAAADLLKAKARSGCLKLLRKKLPKKAGYRQTQKKKKNIIYAI